MLVSRKIKERTWPSPRLPLCCVVVQLRRLAVGISTDGPFVWLCLKVSGPWLFWGSSATDS